MSRYNLELLRAAHRRGADHIRRIGLLTRHEDDDDRLPPPSVLPRHLLPVYRTAHAAALQGMVLADPRVLVRGRLTRWERLAAGHPQVCRRRPFARLRPLLEPARIAAALYDELLWQFPHRAGRLAYYEEILLAEGAVQKARNYGRDPWTSRVWNRGIGPNPPYPEGWVGGPEVAFATVVLRGPDPRATARGAVTLVFYDDELSLGSDPLYPSGRPCPMRPTYPYADPGAFRRLEKSLAERDWPVRLPG